MKQTIWNTKKLCPPAEHPRLMLRREELSEIAERLHTPENEMAFSLWKKLCDVPVTGAGATPEYGSYHLKEYLAVEARAFRALLYPENEGFAREAIDCLHCLEQSFTVCEGNMMAARWGGHLIFLAAEVYDWCYRYLTEAEKVEIIDRCEEIAAKTFEMGYPPVRQTALSGHGSEAQLLRDLLAFSIAVYDERPDIYSVCAGRILDEYVKTNAFHFMSHAHMQGPSYGAYRYGWTLWAAMIFKKMSGIRIFDENFERTADYFYYTLRPDGEMFRLGDDCIETKAAWLAKTPVVAPMFLAGVYTGEPRYLDYFRRNCTDRHMLSEKWGMDFYEEDSYGEGMLSPVTVLLWNRPELYHVPIQPFPKACCFPYPLGMTVWKNMETETSVLMKIGELWGSNHDHLDTGCFQIYHRGILASDSGVYDGYHTSHRKNYLIRTSSHNCITVKDPDSSTKNWEAADGGVRRPMSGAEPKNIEEWAENYRMATVISHYESESFCEITGDLTEAYRDTCQSVIRSMRFDEKEGKYGTLTVRDHIVAKKENFTKTFHLHVPAEPVIHEREILIRNGQGGGLRCSVIYPEEAEITAVGGAGREFMVEGTAYPTAASLTGIESGWGQVMIRPAKANREDLFVIKMTIL